MALKKKLSVTYVPSKQDNTRVAKTPYKQDEESDKSDSAAMARNLANHQAATRYAKKNKKKPVFHNTGY